MGPLPIQRIDFIHPFANTGIDPFGPLEVKINGKLQKRHIVMFTCLNIRAVHLEVVKTLNTQCFINALLRFTARRPGVRHIFCDNAKQLIAAHKELKEAVTKWNQIVPGDDRFSHIQWSFRTPHNPSWGGVWERAIGETKKALYTLINKRGLKLDEFNTIVISAESIVNSRPLTKVSSDPRDLNAICPNDLLYPGSKGQSTGAVILPPLPAGGKEIRKYTGKISALLDNFWHRFHRTYLQTLQTREKWMHVEPNLRVGQLVLVVEKAPRHKWRLGRILEILSQSGDGLARRVKVLTSRYGKNGEFEKVSYERDRSQVVALELDADPDSQE